MNRMWQCVCFLGAYLFLLTTAMPARSKNNCEKKEKSLISLDIAEDLTSKVKDILPNCTDVVGNKSDCGIKDKASAYLDIVNNLISEAKKNYPQCIETGTRDPDIEEPVTKEPETKDPVTEEPETREPKEYPKSRDCSEVLQNGQNVSGVYTIWPSSSSFPNKSLEVFCDMDTDGGGWTIVQRRGKYEPQENFYRDWNDYKNGFGNITKDFWLGNDNLFILSNQGKYKIRFELESVEGEKAYALYETFFIEDEDSKYKLHIENYAAGTAGDAMHYDNGMFFATKDRDNVYKCVQQVKGGWWYRNCSYSSLNGEYRPGSNDWKYITWYYWKKDWIGLAGSEIKIKALVN